MEAEEEWGREVTIHPNQLAIEVPPSGGIARFTADDEIAAYRAMFGEDKTREQMEAAKRAKSCSCGKQASANAERAKEHLAPKQIKGSQHLPGCPKYTKIAAVRHVADEAEVKRGFAP